MRANALVDRDEVETLKERVRQLEEALLPVVSVPLEWQLTKVERRAYACLASRPLASKDALMIALYAGAREEPNVKHLDLVVHRLRKKLEPFGFKIKASWGEGWRLSRSRIAA